MDSTKSRRGNVLRDMKVVPSSGELPQLQREFSPTIH